MFVLRDPESPFDDLPQLVETVTVNNITHIGYQKMLEGVMPFVLTKVPEGTNGGDPEVLTILDSLMGRYANTYAYLITLFAAAAGGAERYKAMGDDVAQSSMIRKKDALWELSRAVKLKYQACSRMLTKHIEDDDDLPERVDVRARAGRAEKFGTYRTTGSATTKEPRQPKGWANIE